MRAINSSGLEGTLSLAAAFAASVLFFATASSATQAQAQDSGYTSTEARLKTSSSSAKTSSEGLQVSTLDGPAKAFVGEPVTYRAMVHRSGMESSMSYHWQFGDGGSEDSKTAGLEAAAIMKHLAEQSSLVATHTYERPGTYTVTVATRSGSPESGLDRATASATVTVVDSSSSDSAEGARIASGKGVQDDRGAQRKSKTEQIPKTTQGLGAAQNSGGPQGSGMTSRERPGEWGIVVASMRSAEKAGLVADRYRNQLDPERMPVEIMEAMLDGWSHFRVVIGRFDSQGETQRAIVSRKDVFPLRAWTIRYQNRFLSEAGS